MSVVLSSVKKGVLSLVLNRPKALNALDAEMVGIMRAALESHPQERVFLKGFNPADAKHSAFCAGGDIVQVQQSALDRAARIKNGEDPELKQATDLCSTFFADEYKLDYELSTRPDTVALMNGITMGGGVGLSVNTTFRVATDKSVFAMPETAIGFFCDVGGSWFLPRLEGNLGMYLALTGARLTGAQLVEAGIATHYVGDASEEAVTQLVEDADGHEALAAQLDALAQQHTVAPSLVETQSLADATFGENSVEEIMALLKVHELSGTESQQKFATTCLKQLKHASPLALKVVHSQLQRGAELNSIADAYRMEYTISQRFMEHGEFSEGVRALLVDKDRKPKWSHNSVVEVTDELVDSFFMPKTQLERSFKV